MTAERFTVTLTVTLEARPDRLPAAVRLRRFLKLALRRCGLRCVRLEPATDCESVGREPQTRSREPPAESGLAHR